MAEQHPTTEQWRPVVGYEGLYEVSDHGRVRSVDRMVETCNSDRRYRGRILKAGAVRGAHLFVTLCNSGDATPRYVHQLVAEAFIGPRNRSELVLHSNDDPSDNRVSNLRYGNHSDNMQDSLRNGKHGGIKKTHCKWGHKFTPDNTYPNGPNGRGCKTCRSRRSREFRERRSKASS